MMAENSLPQLVRDLMTVGVVTCPPETPLSDLAQLILETGQEDIVVLEEGHALGVVGQTDLVKAFAHQDFQSLQARDILREGVPQVPPDIPLRVAAQIMDDQGIRTLFLMHHAGGIEYPAAMISYTHLLRWLAARDHTDLRDLGIRAERQSPLERFLVKREAARRENLGGGS
jgi:predicted transcriptional regulator